LAVRCSNCALDKRLQDLRWYWFVRLSGACEKVDCQPRLAVEARTYNVRVDGVLVLAKGLRP
jgi:hypothetical protein